MAGPPAEKARLDEGIWTRALAAHFVRDMMDKPADLPAWSCAAQVSLAAGDQSGYRRTCAAIIEAFLTSKDANQINSAIWVCAVGPDAVTDFEPLVQRLMAVLGPTPDPNLLNTLGALLYRAGRFGEAVRRLDESIARRDKVGTVQDFLFLAMAHQRLGNGEEARKWLDKSLRALQQDAGGSWEQRLELALLRREAEASLHR
jgi:Flp pilus assembly protein TadD